MFCICWCVEFPFLFTEYEVKVRSCSCGSISRSILEVSKLQYSESASVIKKLSII